MNTLKKNNVLEKLAELLQKNLRLIIDENKKDLSSCEGSDKSLIDRLKVDEKKIHGMISSVKKIISSEDPVGKSLYAHTTEDEMKIVNRTVPFGKILIIYESRPDVTIEAAITAFKSGNKILLKGGKEARNSNLALVNLWHEALSANDVSTEYVQYLDLDRTETQKLIKENPARIDLIIPRGGEGLINFIRENSNIPLIISGRGNNFLYLDKESDFDMAIKIIINGKSRLSVCNALDKVLINKSIPNIQQKISQLVTELQKKSIDVWGDASSVIYDKSIIETIDKDIFYQEFLSAKIFMSMVDDIDESIEIINRCSGGHSAVIISKDEESAKKFQNEVDCAAVYHNASSRFTDGGAFGLGAEIAISTQKLHFRGPVGLSELVTNKWFISGNGHIRT